MSRQVSKPVTPLLLATLALLLMPAAGTGAAKIKPAAEPAPAVLSVQNPRRVSEGPDGTVMITDRRHGAVIAVDKETLEPLWSVPLPGEGQPFGIAFAGKFVFVGNTVSWNVEAYKVRKPGGPDASLKFAYNLGGGSEGSTGDLERPIAVAVDADADRIFVLDGTTKQIRLFDMKGRLQSAFEPRDSGGLLLSPVSMTVDVLRREILVGDYGDPAPWFSGCGFCGAAEPARILIYDYDGELLFEIMGDGSTDDSARFSRIQGMASSADGRIFAADPLGSRILVFDRFSGALLAELGEQGTGEGQLMAPLDVWLDEGNGDLFISNNRGARRVEVLRGVGGQP